ncbi:DUF429 domain-containing protein [Kineosporia succinea]|uniref:RNase H-like nuclease/ppGpp synthetase/RelA/SpoT-type nucleotidyltransferase n=1 Tax=Kineosporia succinea TaxID=84632 RepID=A0ABT9P8B5_9ACTN|nr:DUF429 domain-containing protein [Kineosporia succinea]MDP9828707.1 putative RNase H-like nuclease/ppGpp synthetase/RelA/SpoT-type nucleotidyltransferase [Kineosporia succinea]
MYYVGVDLAWGDRKPTGLAVLDDEGGLVHVSAAQSDEEILAALAPYTAGDCLVAIDAPLIVRNETGNRPAEAALNKDFARFHAGAHPVNTTKPEFSGTPRGARIAHALKLDLNPRSGRGRRAMEVYPHAACISLFRLGRTLKYKAKPGRTRDLLQSELLRLMGLVGGLAGAEPPLHLDRPGSRWPELIEAAGGAVRKSELRVVEDQVDAVICAYTALFGARHPQMMTTYGDVENGYIVTPTLPEGLEPSSADDPTAEDPVSVAVRDYALRQPALVDAADTFVALVTSILDEAGINYLSVNGRAKAVASFAGKASRRGPNGELVYTDPLREINDQIGVRVITYVQDDVATVADVIHDQLLVKKDRDMGEMVARQGRFGYRSRHMLIALDAAREGHSGYEQLRGQHASLQVRTVLQHAWAEFEHDIRYKGTVPADQAPELDRRFTLAAGLLELADQEFSIIRDRLLEHSTPAVGDNTTDDDTSGRDTADDDSRIGARELAAFLAGQYPGSGWSRTEHYTWITGLLAELAITSLPELTEVLLPVNELDLNARMAYKYPPGAVRRLDDALLAAFGEKYVGLPGNADRRPLLKSRLEKLHPDETGEPEE